MPDYPAPEFLAKVKEGFSFLFTEYGMTVAHEEITQSFDFCSARFASSEFWVKVGREKGYIFVHVGSSSHPDIGFTLQEIIAKLEEWTDFETHQAELIPPEADWSLGDREPYDQQLKWYAAKLKSYGERIQLLFSDSTFAPLFRELLQQKYSELNRLLEQNSRLASS